MSEKKILNFVGINEQIASKINETANESAVNKVVSKRVEAEVTRRADLIEKALSKYDATVASLKGCKPDVVTFGVVTNGKGEDAGAAVENKSYSAAKWKEKESFEKLLADLEIAILKAFSTKREDINEGYIRLQKLIGSGKPDNKNDKPEE